MSVTIDSVTWAGLYTCEVAWSSDQVDPTYYVWVDGSLWAETPVESMTFTVGADEQPVIEVFDSADARPAAARFPARLTLAWYHVPDAAEYRIDEYLTDRWARRAVITDDGRWFFTWRSRVLADNQVHRFRIIAVDAAGNAADPVERQALMVRHPDAPRATYTYDEPAAEIVATVAA